MRRELNRFMKIKAFLLLLFVTALSCDGGGGGSAADSRPFYLGFSPWLYEATADAQNWVYTRLASDGDIVSHHMEEGVPWPESYSGDPFSTEYRNEINSRVARRSAGQKFVLQISPLNVGRNGMALYRGSGINESIPSPWDGYSLDSAEVKTAFLNYAKRMVEAFNPDFLLIGVESNLLVRNNPSLWSAYVSLHSYVYTGLKAVYPSLPVSVSFFCVPFFPEWSSEDNLTAQMNALHDLEPYLDFVSFSVHPFMSALLCETFPDDYMSRLFAVTSKPVAVSESSYSAQVWSTVSPALTFNGSQEKQDNFASRLLSASRSSGAYFVIWFSIRDYDTLWADTLGSSEAALVWRDTGLYDEAGNPRDAWYTWMEWRGKPFSR